MAREIDLGGGRFIALQATTFETGEPGCLIRCRRPEEPGSPTCIMRHENGEIVTYFGLSVDGAAALGVLIAGLVGEADQRRLDSSPVAADMDVEATIVEED